MQIYISPERARLVHAWHLRAPTWTPPTPSITCRRRYFFYFVLCCVVLFCFVCVRVPRARHRGRARRHRGCRRALAGRRGVGKSAVAVFVARCRVCLETREKQKWALSGLLMSVEDNMFESMRVVSELQSNIQAVLVFATMAEFRRETIAARAPTLSSWRTRATLSTGFTRGARRSSPG